MRKTSKINRTLAFGIVTALPVAWGIMTQYLCERLGCTPFLKEYLLHPAPFAGIFILLWSGLILGRNKHGTDN